MASDRLRFGAVELPIRQDQELTEQDKCQLPVWDPHYEIDSERMEELALCVLDRVPGLLVGPTGCGKDSALLALASLLNQPVQRTNMHADVRVGDLLGEKTLEVDEATGQSVVLWRDGILPSAMRAGHWLILDEIDTTPAGIAMVLQQVLEAAQVLTLAANYGEVVKPHPCFRLWATANTLGHGDDSGLYAGTNVLNEATLDRFLVIQFGYLGKDAEARVVALKGGIGATWAHKLVEVATLVRNGAEKLECTCTFSTRRLVRWATVAKRLGLTGVYGAGTAGKLGKDHPVVRALRLAVLNKLDKEQAEYVKGVAKRVLGSL